MMIIVYVKHYLNHEGLEYFDDTWFPTVRSVISKQPGYISIDCSNDEKESGCKNIIVKFDSEAHLNAWAASKRHDEIVDHLDKYRIGPWRAVRFVGHNVPSINDER